MITMNRLVSYVSAEPFRPFRINMASGKAFEIRHPEMVAVSKSSAYVFTSMSEDPDEAKEREHEISLMLIESIEPLSLASQHERGQD